MSSLEQVSMPGIGTGIRIPNVNYRFRVLFNHRKQNLDILSDQLIRVGEHPTSTLEADFFFQDDAAGLAAKALWGLYRTDTERITIEVQYLDGNDGVTRTHVLEGAELMSVEFSALDYAGGASDQTYLLKSSDDPNSEQSDLVNAVVGVLNNTKLIAQIDRSTTVSTIYARFKFERFLLK